MKVNSELQEWKINSLNLALWLAIAILFTTVQVQLSLRQGQLSLPPSYDDISYFNDALNRLQIFYNDGFKGLLHEHMQNPPHSPLSTLIPFLGFTILGIRDWTPSFMNFILVFLSLIFFDYLTHGLTLKWKVIIIGTTLTWLLMGHLVIECRPDIFCGFLTAGTIIIITEKPWFNNKRSRQVVIGTLFGLALLAKPSISPLTIILILFAITLNILTDIFISGYRVKWHQYLIVEIRSLALIAGITLLIALPHYIFAFKKIIKYIYETETNLHIWGLKLRVIDNLTYYLTGQGGLMMTKNWLYLWLLLTVFTMTFAIYRKDYNKIIRVPALVGTILLAYAVVTISEHKTPFIGVIISCFLLITSVQMLSYILISIQFIRFNFLKKVFYILFVGFCSLSIFLFEWPAPNDVVSPHPASSAERRYYFDIVKEIYQDINQAADKNSQKEPKILYLSSISNLVNRDILLYYQNKLGDQNITINDGSLTDQLSVQLDGIKKSDFILVFLVPSPDVLGWLPSVKIQGEVLKFLNNSPNFQLIKTYLNPYTGGKSFLFKKMVEEKF